MEEPLLEPDQPSSRSWIERRVNSQPTSSSSNNGGFGTAQKTTQMFERLHCGRAVTTRACLDDDWALKLEEDNSFCRNKKLKDRIMSTRKGEFKMKTCKQFIEDKSHSNDSVLCQCGRPLEQHHREVVLGQSATLEWNSNDHTEEVPTDGQGLVQIFSRASSGTTTKSAKYVRLSDNTCPSVLYDFMRDGWKLRDPNIIISCIGGTKDFYLDSDLLAEFKRSLVKSAKDSGAWIVTGGIDSGVTKIVGEAIREQPQKIAKNLTVLAFAGWGILKGKASLKGENTHYVVPEKFIAGELEALNPDHSHFVLVDDGSEGQYGREIRFKHRFLNYISFLAGTDKDNEHHLPVNQTIERKTSAQLMNSSDCKVVRVLLEGEPNATEIIYTNLQRRVPIVLVEHSGKAANIISFAKRKAICSIDPLTGSKKVDFHPEVLETLENDMVKLYNWKDVDYEKTKKKVEQHINYLKFICSEENDRYVTLFCYRDPKHNDLDQAILGALIKAMQKESDKAKPEELKEQLSISMKWNRPDIALKYVLNRKITFDQCFLQTLFLECLLDNKHQFVDVLLQNGLNIQSQFRSVHALEQLFVYKNSDSNEFLKSFIENNVLRVEKSTPFFIAILSGIQRLVGGGFELSLMNEGQHLNKRHQIPEEVYEAREFQKNYRDYYNEKIRLERNGVRYLTHEAILNLKNPPPQINDPSFILFLWAVIMNYHEMAKTLWKFGDNYLAKALLAKIIYNNMSEEFPAADDLKIKEQEFENISMELLEFCCRENEIEARQMIVSQLSICSSHSILGLAVLAEQEEFVAHSCSQLILDEIWSGGIKQTENLTLKVLLCIFCPIMALVVFDYDYLGNIFDGEDHEDDEMDNEIQPSEVN